MALIQVNLLICLMYQAAPFPSLSYGTQLRGQAGERPPAGGHEASGGALNAVEIRDGEVVIDGVAGKDVVAALRGTGLSEEAVVSLLGRFIAQSGEPASGPAAEGPVAGEVLPGQAAAAADPNTFTFVTQIAQSAPECAVNYVRTFVHPDFVDGLTVVQAGTTPEELGFNARFHGLETEFDAVAVNLYRLSNCLAELRNEVFGMARELEAKITEIETALHTKAKDKEGKDTKEGKETKEGKDTKEGKEGKDKEKEKDKEGKDKEKEHKDKDKDRDKLAPVEKLTAVENFAPPEGTTTQSAALEPDDATQRTFIQPQDRPPVGEKALEEPGEEATQEPAGSRPAAEPGAGKAPPKPRRKRAPRKPAGTDG